MRCTKTFLLYHLLAFPSSHFHFALFLFFLLTIFIRYQTLPISGSFFFNFLFTSKLVYKLVSNPVCSPALVKKILYLDTFHQKLHSSWWRWIDKYENCWVWLITSIDRREGLSGCAVLEDGWRMSGVRQTHWMVRHQVGVRQKLSQNTSKYTYICLYVCSSVWSCRLSTQPNPVEWKDLLF